MKKILVFLSILILTFVFVGCTSDFDTNTEMTFLTSSSTRVTTTNTIDGELIMSDIYQMIYSEIYDDVRAEVIENISEDRFDQLYSEIVDELLLKIADGTITISPQNIADMILNVENDKASAVVGVTTFDSAGEGVAIGSGVIYKNIGDKYYIVTNNHVVEDATSYEIQFEDGTTIGAVLRGVDTLVDLAVLYFISEDDYTVVDFADSSLVQKGDIVLAVGNPSGYDFFGSITMGIISGLNRYFDIDEDGVRDMFVNYIQHDAAINSGNSGGALFDINGDVIGINVLKYTDIDIEGMGFAIPSNLVSSIVSDIEEFGVSNQIPVLGIQFMEIRNNESNFEYQGIVIPDEITDGFYIISVYDDKSFSDYVQAGDIIVEIGGIALTTSLQFKESFSQYVVGDTISIRLYRNGSYITIDNILLTR